MGWMDRKFAVFIDYVVFYVDTINSRSACIDPQVKRSRSHGYENRTVASE